MEEQPKEHTEEQKHEEHKEQVQEQTREQAHHEPKEEHKPHVEHHAEPKPEPVRHEPRKKISIKEVYEKEYKKLLIIPFTILFIALFLIVMKASTTGDFINKDVSLKGGITLTIPYDKEVDTRALASYLQSAFAGHDVSVRSLKQAGAYSGIVFDADIEQEQINDFVAAVEKQMGIGLKEGDYSVEVMGSSLGASFFKETIRAVLIAFLFMGIVVFISFRVPAVSLAVILAALSDIIVTLAIVNVLGIKLSTAGIAAFLMLIGYSVDTDILLSTKVIKRKQGTTMERIYNAMKTGLMMNGTTIAAIIVALIFTKSEVISQIMTILLIGLLVDIINTWIQNVGILRLYLEKKHHH